LAGDHVYFDICALFGLVATFRLYETLRRFWGLAAPPDFACYHHRADLCLDHDPFHPLGCAGDDRKNHVRTARAKGLPQQRVTSRHILLNASIPIVTIIGLQLASLLGGVIIVEIIFAWPGLGRLALDAVTRRDYPMVQGAVLMVALAFAIVNLIVDLLYAYLDPRVKY
jgi:hypothetical protein